MTKPKVTRKKIAAALRAEGVDGLMEGYANVHMLPMYQKKIAYGSSHFPWSHSESDVSYAKGICPIAENLHESTFLGLQLCTHALTSDIVDDIVSAFHKVWSSFKS